MTDGGKKILAMMSDYWAKRPGSNISKVFQILGTEIDEMRGVADKVEEWRDVDKAEGTSLELLAANIDQKRGIATDEILRLLVKSKAARGNSAGTIDDIIHTVAVSLDADPSLINLVEMYNDPDYLEPAALRLAELPLAKLSATGISATQFARIVKRSAAPGVRVAEIELSGTFSFSSDQDHIVKGRSVTNLKSKVSGSGVLNPNVMKALGNGSGLPAPTSYTFEVTTNDYARMASLDGQTYRSGATTDTRQTSHLFVFKVIDHVERVYGPVPGATLANKVAWLKANITNFTVSWHGFGTYSGGARANLTRWNADTNAWLSIAVTNAFHTSPTTQQLVFQPAVANSIDANGYVYVLAYSEPATASVGAYLETDFVQMTMQIGTETEGFADLPGTTGGTLSGLLVPDDDINLPL